MVKLVSVSFTEEKISRDKLTKGSGAMYFDNRNRPQTSVYGCSSSSLMLGLVLLFFVMGGSLFLVFRYLGLIIALGIVVWLFRKIVNKNETNYSEPKAGKRPKSGSWSRDFEQKENTSYDNLERDFEEVDDDEFNDF